MSSQLIRSLKVHLSRISWGKKKTAHNWPDKEVRTRIETFELNYRRDLHGADFPRCEFLNFIKLDVSVMRENQLGCVRLLVLLVCGEIEKEKDTEKRLRGITTHRDRRKRNDT